MRTTLLLLVTSLAVMLDTSLLAHPAAPSLRLLIVAWLLSGEQAGTRLWVLCWLVGMLADAADPGSVYGYSLLALFCCGLGQSIRPYLPALRILQMPILLFFFVLSESLLLLLVNPGGFQAGQLFWWMASTLLTGLLLASISKQPRLAAEPWDF